MIRFVTTNEGKFREVAAILSSNGIEIGRLDMPYREIQADALEDVVQAGLDSLSSVQGDLVIDDSGLFVDALDGFPGVYSSYAFRTIGVNGLLCLMEGRDSRSARFDTVLGLRVGGDVQVLHGRIDGTIASEVRGVHGFGFDPVFVPEGHSRTFAEMDTDEKNAISHRGRAAVALARFLKER